MAVGDNGVIGETVPCPVGMENNIGRGFAMIRCPKIMGIIVVEMALSVMRQEIVIQIHAQVRFN